MKIDISLDAAYSSTNHLAQRLRKVADGHGDDPAVFHIGHALGDRCEEMADTLIWFRERYAQPVSPGLGLPTPDSPDETEELPDPGLSLLRDLRELATEAIGAQMDWAILRQGAQVARDEPLFVAATVGVDEMKRVGAWLSTRIKESAPQILAV